MAARAVATFVGWAVADARLDAVVAEIAEGNDASVRVAERCGFALLRPATAETPAVHVVRR